MCWTFFIFSLMILWQNPCEGYKFATGSDDFHIKIGDGSSSCSRILNGKENVVSVDVDVENQILVAGTIGKLVVFWNLTSNESKFSSTESQPVNSVVLIYNNRLIAGYIGFAIVWTIPSLTKSITINDGGFGEIKTMFYLKNEKRVLMGSMSNLVFIISTDTFTIMGKIDTGSKVQSIDALNKDFIVFQCGSLNICLFTLSSDGNSLIKTSSSGVVGFDIFSIKIINETFVVFGMNDNFIGIWRVKTTDVEKKDYDSISIAKILTIDLLSPDIFATGDINGDVYLWNLTTWKRQLLTKCHSAQINSLKSLKNSSLIDGKDNQITTIANEITTTKQLVITKVNEVTTVINKITTKIESGTSSENQLTTKTETITSTSNIVTTRHEAVTDNASYYPISHTTGSYFTESTHRSTINQGTTNIQSKISTVPSFVFFMSSIYPKTNDVTESSIRSYFIETASSPKEQTHNPTSLTSISFDVIQDFLDLNDQNVDLIVKLMSINEDLNNCLKNCSSHGRCKVINKISFKCDCFTDYTGPSCDVDKRPCSSNPCLNNGSCSNDLENQTYNCECSQSSNISSLFIGKNCENKIDLCANETCSNNGICYDKVNRTECKCFKDYNGEKCEVESNEIKVIKAIIRTSSIVAIVVITLTYLCFLVNDILNLFRKNPTRRVYKQRKNEKIIKYVYVN